MRTTIGRLPLILMIFKTRVIDGMKILPVGWRGNYETTFLHSVITWGNIFSSPIAILEDTLMDIFYWICEVYDYEKRKCKKRVWK